MSKEIVITGGDSAFFPFLWAALRSMRKHAELAELDFGIVDQGLEETQKEQLSRLGCRIVTPTWTLPVPAEHRQLKNIGLVARPALRDYFPGYQIYLWFDADAWVQTPEFLRAYIEGARRSGAAVATENGSGYRKTLTDRKWWIGNMFAAYGLRRGLRCSAATSVNIGILCLSSNAPHWAAWTRFYTEALERTGKVNLDQHAFLAAIECQGLDTAFMPARFNWQPFLSAPVWDSEQRLLCEPEAPYRPLSVVHLAGPNKQRGYALRALSGGAPLHTSLTYPAMEPHFSPATAKAA
jgi:hypothetical protein